MYPDVAVVKHGSPRPKSSESRPATVQADEPVLVHAWEEEFREGFVQILERDGHRLVTSLEFVSPTNKSKTDGRKLYLRKQRELADGGVNLVEIDLLRSGRHIVKVPEALVEPLTPWHYLVSIWRPNQSDFEVYPLHLRNPLPRIRIPLKTGDTDAVLDLQALVTRSYDAGPYAERIDYAMPPAISLSADDAAWAISLLKR